MKSINLLSYNLKSHIAYSELADLTQRYGIDIVCLQECDGQNLSDTVHGLTLVAQTTTGTLGLAIYCDNTRFTVISNVSIPICLSTYERIYTQDRERLIVVELFDHVNKLPLFVASFHATHLVATNRLRRKQLSTALEIVNSLSHEHPAILAGDFNYPFFHSRLGQTAHKNSFDLVIPQNSTFYGRRFRGIFDMATVSKMNARTSVLPFGQSDHAPVLLQLDPTSPSVAGR